VGQHEQQRQVERAVRAEHPGLSPTANRLLTRELRDALGSGSVRAAPVRARQRGRVSRAAGSACRRFLLLALSAGAVLALLTHSWWALVGACGVHAAGTLLAAGGAFELMKRREHVSLELAARLEQEGVADPDRVLTDLLRTPAVSAAARGTTAYARGSRARRRSSSRRPAASRSTATAGTR